MKKIVLSIVLLIVAASVSFAAVLDANVAYVSHYMFRGYDLNLGQPALQPCVYYYLGDTGLNLCAWGSFNIGTLTKRELNEVDYTLTYASTIGEELSYSVYYSAYTYPRSPASKTGEVFFNFTGNKLPLTPSLTLSYDNELGKGAYVNLAGKNSFNVGNYKLDASATVGYDGGQFGVTPGISDGSIGLSSSVSAWNLNITPSVNYVMINKECRPLDQNLFWFGLNVATSI